MSHKKFIYIDSPVLDLKGRVWLYWKSQKISTASDQHFLSQVIKTYRRGGVNLSPPLPCRNRVKSGKGVCIVYDGEQNEGEGVRWPRLVRIWPRRYGEGLTGNEGGGGGVRRIQKSGFNIENLLLRVVGLGLVAATLPRVNEPARARTVIQLIKLNLTNYFVVYRENPSSWLKYFIIVYISHSWLLVCPNKFVISNIKRFKSINNRIQPALDLIRILSKFNSTVLN